MLLSRRSRRGRIQVTTTSRDIFLRAAELLGSDKYRAKIIQTMGEEAAAPAYWAMTNVIGSTGLFRTQAGMVERLKGEVFRRGRCLVLS